MNDKRKRRAELLLRFYLAAALITAAVLSPFSRSFIPIILLAWCIYLWVMPMPSKINLLTQYFMFFALSLLFTSQLGPLYAWLIALPLLVSLSLVFQKTAQTIGYEATSRTRRPTNLAVVAVATALVLLCFALVFNSQALLFTAATITTWFVALGSYVFVNLSGKPVVAVPQHMRIIAGQQGEANIILVSQTKVGGRLFIESPYDWYKVSPSKFIPLKPGRLGLRALVTPPLAGPSSVKLKAYAVDRWGLFQVQFDLEPLKLIVIPRARYAQWLARKYIAGTKVGTLPLIPNVGVLRPLYGLRQGMEYYGNREYQYGDSLKHIDWKYLAKYNKLVVREFIENQSQLAILLINTVASNADEVDKLAYNILACAISLAQKNIPAAFAAYSNDKVVLATSALNEQALVSQALQVVNEIIVIPEAVKYLEPPDVSKLMVNINCLRPVASQPARVLEELLRLEYQNLSHSARLNPGTWALSKVLAKTSKQSSIVIISSHNHDAEALAFHRHILPGRGNAVITI